MLGVALDARSPAPDGLALIEAPPGTWAAFRTTTDVWIPVELA